MPGFRPLAIPVLSPSVKSNGGVPLMSLTHNTNVSLWTKQSVKLWLSLIHSSSSCTRCTNPKLPCAFVTKWNIYQSLGVRVGTATDDIVISFNMSFWFSSVLLLTFGRRKLKRLIATYFREIIKYNDGLRVIE